LCIPRIRLMCATAAGSETPRDLPLNTMADITAFLNLFGLPDSIDNAAKWAAPAAKYAGELLTPSGCIPPLRSKRARFDAPVCGKPLIRM